MSTNPIDENATPKTTGNLEELFRHHLGEEAAVPPRPMLWDQIDNSLLIRQNEQYRRRLVATRWVAAASLLLATLAGTGWWARRDTNLSGPAVATTAGSREAGATVASPASGLASGRRSVGSAGASAPAASSTNAAGPLAAASRRPRVGTSGNSASQAAQGTDTYYVAAAAAAQYQAASRSAARAEFGPTRVRANHRNEHIGGLAAVANGSGAMDREAASASYLAATAAQRANNPQATENQSALGTALNSPAVAARENTVSAATVASLPAAGNELAAAGTEASAMGLAAATTAPAVGLLAARTATLALTDGITFPKNLATLPLAEADAATPPPHWTYGASCTASVFNPNINFSRVGIEPEYDYSRNPALGPNSTALTEAAAAQYRENLRPGFSQRLALLATRHLRGHWLLSTGAEFTQATAQSASSSSFVGEQLYDLGVASRSPLRTTNFRYRMASVPAEVRYTNPAKQGWSLYGRLGGVVSSLLGVRSEVSGEPEATRTYSIASAGTPYRRVLANVRGGAGAQFRSTTGNWTVTMGPVAEMGLLSLNAHPAQSYLAQSRPYSFGMEAGIEFGR